MTETLRQRLMAFGNSANPFDRRNGIRVVGVEEGMAQVEVALSGDSLNSWGAPHGGLLFTMADVACGVAAVSTRQEQCVTANASIDFISAAGGEGRILAEGRVLRSGGKLCFCAAEVRDEEGTLLVRMNTTMYFTGKKLEI